MIGGPLLDAGFPVTLIDAAAEHLSDAVLVERITHIGADIVMTAHVGSTQAHPCCLRILRAIKAALPQVATVYGGVFPTYHKEILGAHREVDLIVRGEGEATALDLVQTLSKARQLGTWTAATNLSALDLSGIEGIVWRRAGQVVMNPSRPAIDDLDRYRIGWELIEDWDLYQAFGLGRAAVVQFSRGCPHTCTYCGQWMFWKRWRHRDVQAFVEEMAWLYRENGVRFFWIADENPTTLQDVWRSVLEEIARRGMNAGLCASIRAQDIVRDADFLHLYKAAGFTYVLMGIETVTDQTLDKVRKGSCVDDGYHAVRLLRQHNIMSIIDYIFGLEEETPQTLWRGLRGLLRYDGDFVNALYVTPHSWTPLGGAMAELPRVEEDQWKWDYRHQVVGVKRLTPGQLFLGVKIVEFLYHLHPRRLLRLLTAPDARLRRQMRFAYRHISP
jgi:anaerobic magnesium-protoporphyrin IX monomethyl ester cyclase